MPNTQNLATVGVTNRQDTDNIIVEQGGNIRRVQYEDIKTGILRGDAADGTISTFEESAEEFPIPAPATPQKTLWGRVKKFCSDFNDWKTGVMLFGHLVNNAESDSDTLPLAASVAKLLQEQITTNAGAIAQLNSDFNSELNKKLNKSDFSRLHDTSTFIKEINTRDNSKFTITPERLNESIDLLIFKNAGNSIHLNAIHSYSNSQFATVVIIGNDLKPEKNNSTGSITFTLGQWIAGFVIGYGNCSISYS